MTSESIANINGQISALSDAKIPLTDRGLLFGHAIFETILVWDNELVAWHEHAKRLASGCSQAHLRLPDFSLLEGELYRTIAHNHSTSEKKQIRLIVTGGSQNLNLRIQKSPSGELPDSSYFIICRDAPVVTNQKKSFSVKLSMDKKHLTSIKSCNYLASLIALEEATTDGFDDCLFYNAEGFISESTIASFIWQDQNRDWHTPAADCLPGTTTQLFSKALQRQGNQLHESALHRTQIDGIRQCALLSSVRGLVPIHAIAETKVLIDFSEIELLKEILFVEQKVAK